MKSNQLNTIALLLLVTAGIRAEEPKTPSVTLTALDEKALTNAFPDNSWTSYAKSFVPSMDTIKGAMTWKNAGIATAVVGIPTAGYLAYNKWFKDETLQKAYDIIRTEQGQLDENTYPKLDHGINNYVANIKPGQDNSQYKNAALKNLNARAGYVQCNVERIKRNAKRIAIAVTALGVLGSTGYYFNAHGKTADFLAPYIAKISMPTFSFFKKADIKAETPNVQAPAVQTPEVQTPAVQASPVKQ